MRTVFWLVTVAILGIGVYLVGYAAGTPGNQTLAVATGGGCLGVHCALLRLFWEGDR